MEIEVGEFIKTKAGYIRQIIGFCDCKLNHLILDKAINGDSYLDQEDIVKHSKKISDLLECEDVLKIDVGFSYILFYISTITTDKFIDGTTEIKKSDIEKFIIKDGAFTGCQFTIVTKEQFKSVEYRLEE